MIIFLFNFLTLDITVQLCIFYFIFVIKRNIIPPIPSDEISFSKTKETGILCFMSKMSFPTHDTICHVRSDRTYIHNFDK